MNFQHGFFICHTKDLSMPLQSNPTDDCVWNRSIKKPFDFFTPGSICPKIIQGSFFSTDFGMIKLYQFFRIVCESCGPVSSFRGTTPLGTLGNMATTEVIVGRSFNISFEFIFM